MFLRDLWRPRGLEIVVRRSRYWIIPAPATASIAGLQRQHPRHHIEHLPSYAPELNQNSTQTREPGAWPNGNCPNGCSHDVPELMNGFIASTGRIRKSPAKLRECIEQSEPPFLAPIIALLMPSSITST